MGWTPHKGKEQGTELVFQGKKEAHFVAAEGEGKTNKSGLATLSPRVGDPGVSGKL